MSDDFPQGFVLSEAAIYSFQCQDHFPDIISFAAAIPPHLQPLFLIPIRLEPASAQSVVASRIASLPSGNTDVSDMFGGETFVTDTDGEIPGTEPGSIFDLSYPGATTHHQEDALQDENIQVPTDTSYMSDVDTTQYSRYPYRTVEKPVRHSSVRPPPVLLMRLALKPSFLQNHAPEKIRGNAKTCTVQLVSYDKKTRVFTFSVKATGPARTVQASLSSVDDVAMSCDCPFWRFNGPEFHAVENQFMLGQPFGRATTPDARDPDRKYWLCKHSYAVLRRLDDFVADVVEENWDLDDEELLEKVDENWDDMEEAAEIPLEEAEAEDVDVTVEDVDAVSESEEEPSGDDTPSELPEGDADEEEDIDPPELPDDNLDEEIDDGEDPEDGDDSDDVDPEADESDGDATEESAPESVELLPEIEEDDDEADDEAEDGEAADAEDDEKQGRSR